MRVAITGANGQLGQALQKVLAPQHEIISLSHADLELGNPSAIETIAATNAQLVIHSAAYTNVDGCARDPQLAFRINTLGTKYVALACQQLDAPMVYVSTNEVFSGFASQPYMEYDATGPINAYGRSKWGGEQVIREVLTRFYITRVAWLFGGERNFVRTVLRLADAPPPNGIRMVADEVGSPTYTFDAATAIAHLITQPAYGTYHIVNAGICSRYDFARTILDRAGHTHVPMSPIALADFKRDSTPPSYTPLANLAAKALGIELRSWQDATSAYLQEIAIP